jgi:short/branched chain acyl-CoA dehydrogenase
MPTMDFDLSPDHELIRRTVREFAEGEVAPVAEELDRTKSFPYEIVAELGKLNLMGIPFPEEYGGGGGDSLAYALAVEELARVDSSVAITLCAHTSLGTQPIYLFGSEEQKREWLPQLCSGERLGAFGLTEPEAGSDAGNTRTRARLQDGEWAIDGAKQFITNAGTEISGVVCITAVTGESDGAGGANGGETDPARPGVDPPHPRTDPARPGEASKEISNIIVPNGTPGYEQGEPYRKMGWNASDTRPLSFADCRVPEENLLGPRGQGFKQFLHVLDIGRIGVAAMGVGLAQGALDQALAYAKERRAFGKPIAKFQAIQGKLADMSTEIAAARLLVHKAACEKDAGRNFTLTAAQAKLKTGRLAVRCAEEAGQIHGGYGFIEEYPVCRFYRDAKILTIGEGTDEVQQMVIARALGA